MEFDWVEIAGRVVIAVSIFFLACWGSNRIVLNMMTGNREQEWETNERTDIRKTRPLGIMAIVGRVRGCHTSRATRFIRPNIWVFPAGAI